MKIDLILDSGLNFLAFFPLSAVDSQIADQRMPDTMEYFVKILDTTLKLVYFDYETKRYKDISMAYPVVEIVNKHLLYDWFKKTWQVRDSQTIKCCVLPMTLILWTT